jgi:hypothetical protein
MIWVYNFPGKKIQKFKKIEFEIFFGPEFFEILIETNFIVGRKKALQHIEWKEIKPDSPGYLPPSSPPSSTPSSPLSLSPMPSSLPCPRCNHSSVTRYDHDDRTPKNFSESFGDCYRMYIFGGANSAESSGRKFFNDLWEYDLAQNRWTELVPKNPDFSPEPRASHVMFLVDDCIYIWGGYSARGLLNDMWTFDIGIFFIFLKISTWCRVFFRILQKKIEFSFISIFSLISDF